MVDFNAADLLVPDGKLDPGWFSGKTVDQVVAMIAGFVDDIPSAISSLDGDDENQLAAMNAYGYGQSFLWLQADYGSRTGTIVLPNEVTAQTTKEASDTFGKLAAYWLGQFYQLVPLATPVVASRPKSYSFTAGFRP